MFSGIYTCRIGIKSKVKNFFQKKLLQIFCLYMQRQFSCPFYKRSYQLFKFQNTITFERGRILKFCKKHLFPCKEIFHISPTLFFLTLKFYDKLKILTTDPCDNFDDTGKESEERSQKSKKFVNPSPIND